MKTSFTFLYTLLIGLFVSSLNAQLVADFESLTTGPDQAFYGQDGVFTRTSGGVIMDITSYGTFDGGFFWGGMAASSYTGGMTGGLEEQFTARNGSGAEGSGGYAVTFGERVVIRLDESVAGGVVEGMSVSNTAYAYFVIRDGNMFSDLFGGESGDDPDFFFLTVKGFSDGELTTDSVNFYLADYRFEDNEQDYIIEDWEFINLSSLGGVDSLELTLKSSDFNNFGILTPAYVAIDNVITASPSSVRSLSDLPEVNLFPNPAKNEVRLTTTQGLTGAYQLYNLFGQRVATGQWNGALNLSGVTAGTYQLLLETESGWLPRRFVKQ
ncbi:hypothetical protein CEQ90_10200 [Lewinellaceae bacterium SD302]|nr:hypothetical protein CEQ90_10200 [Lewinellaceae bacterium SD302]